MACQVHYVIGHSEPRLSIDGAWSKWPRLSPLEQGHLPQTALFGSAVALLAIGERIWPSSLKLVSFTSLIVWIISTDVFLREVIKVQVEGTDVGWEQSTLNRTFQAGKPLMVHLKALKHRTSPFSHPRELEAAGLHPAETAWRQIWALWRIAPKDTWHS